MGVSAKEKKPKDKKEMNDKKSDRQGAFTKKPWNESSIAEKIKGVAGTAATAVAAGGLLYHVLKS